MENKINIARLLKDCPKGMELDCAMYEDVTLIHILEGNTYPIKIETPDGYISLNEYGQYSNHKLAKCIIFPKGKTTWEGFHRPFKDGDIIFTHANCLKVGVGNTWISIYQENRNGGVATYVDYAEDGSDYYTDIDGDKALLCMGKDILRQRLATEEEREKLFQAIKDNGYKWNAETKTLERLIQPKFRVGDRIKHIVGREEIATVIGVEKSHYNLDSKVGTSSFSISLQREWELVPNKFDITTLKPFESRVLVRHNRDNKWCGSFFSHIDEDFHSHCYRFVTLAGKSYPMCIPYEGNQHLLGKVDDCDEFYKTW